MNRHETQMMLALAAVAALAACGSSQSSSAFTCCYDDAYYNCSSQSALDACSKGSFSGCARDSSKDVSVCNAPTSTGDSKACTVVGSVSSFQVTCSKAIESVTALGVTSPSSIRINDIALTVTDAYHIAGSAPGQSSLSFTVAHTDGTFSDVSIAAL